MRGPDQSQGGKVDRRQIYSCSTSMCRHLLSRPICPHGLPCPPLLSPPLSPMSALVPNASRHSANTTAATHATAQRQRCFGANRPHCRCGCREASTCIPPTARRGDSAGGALQYLELYDGVQLANGAHGRRARAKRRTRSFGACVCVHASVCRSLSAVAPSLAKGAPVKPRCKPNHIGVVPQRRWPEVVQQAEVGAWCRLRHVRAAC